MALTRHERCIDAFANAPVAIVFTDPERLRLTYVNSAFLELWGYSSQEDVLDLKLADIWTHPEEVLAAIKALHEHGTWSGLLEARRSDGTTRMVEAHGRMLVDPDSDRRDMMTTLLDVTERVLLEERLLESQRIAHIGSWEWDIKTGALWWSDEIYRIVGLPPSTQPTFQLFLELVHPADRDKVVDAIESALSTGEPYRVRHRITHPEHGERTVDELARFIYGPDGRPLSMSGTAQDVTRLAQIEEALRASEARFRTITETVPFPMSLSRTEDGALQWVNEALADLVGVSRGELMKLSSASFYDTPGRREELLQRIKEDGAVNDMELQIRLPDGRRKDVLAYVRPIVTDGESRLLSTIVDVSELKRTTASLRRSNALFETIISTVPIALFALDRDGCITLSRGRILERIGLEPDTLVGSRLVDIGGCLGELPGVLEAALSGEETWLEGTFRDITFKAMFSPSRDEDGELNGVVGCAFDVTEEHEFERQLQHAQKMRAIGQLAGGVAHDINNVLMIITYGVRLLRDGIPREQNAWVLEELEEIGVAVSRASLLTRQLLAFGKKQPTHPRPTRVVEELGQTLQMLRKMLGEDIQIQFVSTLSSRSIVLIDPAQFEQLLVNLALNAREAMPRGGQLDIALRFLSGGQLELTVRDTGVGMAPETIARIYEPFFSTKGEGRGLGLSVVYGIVEQNQGSITVDSSPGEGTTFVVCLPVELLEETPEDPRQRETEAKLRGQGNILLVEDNAALGLRTQRFLQGAGFSVTRTGNAHEALGHLLTAEVPYALVISDVVMPGMSGFELEDKAHELGVQVPFLHITGYADEALEHFDHAAESLLHKPYDPEALIERALALMVLC